MSQTAKNVLTIPIALLSVLVAVGLSVGAWAQRIEARMTAHDGLGPRVEQLRQLMDDSNARLRRIEIAVARIEGKQTDSTRRFEEEFAH